MVDNIDCKIFCASCNASGSSIYIDANLGELVCKECGVVLDDYVWWNDEIYEQ